MEARSVLIRSDFIRGCRLYNLGCIYTQLSRMCGPANQAGVSSISARCARVEIKTEYNQ